MDSVLDLENGIFFKEPIKILYTRGKKEPWFLAADVSKILKYKSHSFLGKHNNFFYHLKQLPQNCIKFSNSEVYVNIPALHIFIMNSKRPEAQLFTEFMKNYIFPKALFNGKLNNDLNSVLNTL